MLFFLSASGSDERRTKLEIIYREYRDLMLYIANGILGDTNDSEDVVHQSILKLVKVLDKIDAPKSHKTRALVVTVVERTAIDLYRRRQRTNTISLDEDLLVVAPSSPIPFGGYGKSSGPLSAGAFPAVRQRTFLPGYCRVIIYDRSKRPKNDSACKRDTWRNLGEGRLS